MKWDPYGVFLCSTRCENIDSDLLRKLVGDIAANVAAVLGPIANEP